MVPLSRSCTPSELPVIDLKGLIFSDTDSKLAIAREIANACKGMEFFYSGNRGISLAAIGGMFDVTREFFDFPAEKKTELSIKNSGRNCWGCLPSRRKGIDRT